MQGPPATMLARAREINTNHQERPRRRNKWKCSYHQQEIPRQGLTCIIQTEKPLNSYKSLAVSGELLDSREEAKVSRWRSHWPGNRSDNGKSRLRHSGRVADTEKLSVLEVNDGCYKTDIKTSKNLVGNKLSKSNHVLKGKILLSLILL